jgi:hypothetical protein
MTEQPFGIALHPTALTALAALQALMVREEEPTGDNPPVHKITITRTDFALWYAVALWGASECYQGTNSKLWWL